MLFVQQHILHSETWGWELNVKEGTFNPYTEHLKLSYGVMVTRQILVLKF